VPRNSRDDRGSEPTKIDVSRALDRLLQDVAAPLVAAEGQRGARSLGGRGLRPCLRRRLDVGHHVGERVDRLSSARGRRRPGRAGRLSRLELGETSPSGSTTTS
jgi:hypothetical protein